MIDLTSESIGRREHASIRAAGFWATVLALVGAIGYILSVPLQIMSMLSPTQDASITPLFAIAYFWPHFSVPMLLIGGIPWSVTVPASRLALSMYFRRPLSDDATHADARTSARARVWSAR